MNYDKLKDAVMDFYGDTNRSRGQTKSGLEQLRDELDILIDTLDDAESEGE